MHARVDLGLTDEEAWGLTPRQLMDLLERNAELRQAERKLAARNAGEIAATIANANRSKKSRAEPFTWQDFFPEHDGREDAVQTDDDIRMTMRAIASQGRK